MCLYLNFDTSALGNLNLNQNLNKKTFVCLHRSTIVHLYHNLIPVSQQEKKMSVFIEVHNNNLEFSECKILNQKYARTLKARLSYFLMDVISSGNSLWYPIFHV